jgi:hypothetical protein
VFLPGPPFFAAWIFSDYFEYLEDATESQRRYASRRSRGPDGAQAKSGDSLSAEVLSPHYAALHAGYERAPRRSLMRAGNPQAMANDSVRRHSRERSLRLWNVSHHV